MTNGVTLWCASSLSLRSDQGGSQGRSWTRRSVGGSGQQVGAGAEPPSQSAHCGRAVRARGGAAGLGGSRCLSPIIEERSLMVVALVALALQSSDVRSALDKLPLKLIEKDRVVVDHVIEEPSDLAGDEDELQDDRPVVELPTYELGSENALRLEVSQVGRNGAVVDGLVPVGEEVVADLGDRRPGLVAVGFKPAIDGPGRAQNPPSRGGAAEWFGHDAAYLTADSFDSFVEVVQGRPL